MIGDDGGTFESALVAVRRFGGVLEHPAYSIAWQRFGLPTPTRGGWTQAIGDPGITTEVSQSAYGHDARKRTWLYAVGVDPVTLDWREIRGRAVIGAGVNSGECVGRVKLGPTTASRTPEAFRDVLIGLARSANYPSATEVES